MKQVLIVTILGLWLPSASAQTVATNPPTPQTPATVEQVQTVQWRLDQFSQQLAERLKAIESALEKITQRLGDTFRPTTPFNTMERRLEDLEKRLDRVERELQRMNDRLSQLSRGR